MKTKPLERRIHKTAITSDMPSMTKQSFRDEVNIHKIMERFTRTGQIPRARVSTYGIETGADFQSLNFALAEANTEFERLPLELQEKYGSVSNIISLARNPEDRAELARDGVFNIFIEKGAESPSITRSGQQAELELDDLGEQPKSSENEDEKPR